MLFSTFWNWGKTLKMEVTKPTKNKKCQGFESGWKEWYENMELQCINLFILLGPCLSVGIHGGTGIWAKWSLSGNGPQRWVLFWSCCDPVDRARSMYLKVDKFEVGQHEWGNSKRGGTVSKSTALFLPIRRLLILLRTPNPPFKISG